MRAPARRFTQFNRMSLSTWLLAGPTAVGKSEIAVALAERIGGEIVGADAFQIYRGLDLLTAKPSPELVARVPHHLIDEIPPTHSFDVSQYLGLAQSRMAEIRARGKIPIVCGGTGLYFRALTHGLADLPRPDFALRSQLEAKPLPELRAQLAALDPVGAASIDSQNPRRLIRALEVCLLAGRPFSSFRKEWAAPANQTLGCILLLRAREELYSRINERVVAMFSAGVVDEVAASSEMGPTASQALGLREIRDFLSGRISRDECIAAIQQSTRRYAKRQLTWFRKEPTYRHVDAAAPDALERILSSHTDA